MNTTVELKRLYNKIRNNKKIFYNNYQKISNSCVKNGKFMIIKILNNGIMKNKLNKKSKKKNKFASFQKNHH